MNTTICRSEGLAPRSLDISSEKMQKTMVIFKALADETRLKIIYSLIQEGSLCVCEIAKIIDSSNATASHHLNYLKQHKLATSERKGKQIYYQIADSHIKQLVEIATLHSEEEAK